MNAENVIHRNCIIDQTALAIATKQQEMTNRELAEKTGMSYQQICRYLNQRRMRWTSIKKLADALGHHVDDFIIK